MRYAVKRLSRKQWAVIDRHAGNEEVQIFDHHWHAYQAAEKRNEAGFRWVARLAAYRRNVEKLVPSTTVGG